MKDNNKLIMALMAGGASLLMSSIASAGLYVYPVTSGDVISGGGVKNPKNVAYHSGVSSNYVKGNNVYQNTGDGIYAGVQAASRSSDHTVNLSHKNDGRNVPCYGKNVPIEYAISNIFTEYSGYNIAEGVAGMRISWSGTPGECKTLDDLSKIMSSYNEVGIYLNKDNMRIGVSSNLEEAYYYSFDTPKVWRTDPVLSLTENLTKWAESIGWKVEWPDSVSRIDFETADTVVYGDLIGDNGVFHRVLKQVYSRHNDVALSVSFYKNKYIVVSDGGYELNSNSEG